MREIVAMTTIVTLVSMPVLVAEQSEFTGPSSTTQVSSIMQAGKSTGPSGAVTTAANAKPLRGNIRMTLRGKITECTPDDLYKLRDASRVINVDIDHERWSGVTVDPQDTVEIQGEVDRGWSSIETDAKQVRKIVS